MMSGNIKGAGTMSEKKKGRKSVWTDELVEQLLAYWEQGLSAKEIAQKMGQGFTRNAIIGKIHRLRASGKAPARRQDVQSRPEGQNKAEHDARPSRSATASTATSGTLALDTRAEERPAPVAEKKAAPRLVEQETGLVHDIEGLNEHTCRWPIGEPGTNGFSFCGRKPAEGLPYCRHHAAIAYQGGEVRRRATG